MCSSVVSLAPAFSVFSPSMVEDWLLRLLEDAILLSTSEWRPSKDGGRKLDYNATRITAALTLCEALDDNDTLANS